MVSLGEKLGDFELPLVHITLWQSKVSRYTGIFVSTGTYRYRYGTVPPIIRYRSIAENRIWRYRKNIFLKILLTAADCKLPSYYSQIHGSRNVQNSELRRSIIPDFYSEKL